MVALYHPHTQKSSNIDHNVSVGNRNNHDEKTHNVSVKYKGTMLTVMVLADVWVTGEDTK